MPDAQNYAGGVCASGGLKLLVPDAAQHGLIAHYTFDDNRAADSSGHGNHAKVTRSLRSESWFMSLNI